MMRSRIVGTWLLAGATLWFGCGLHGVRVMASHTTHPRTWASSEGDTRRHMPSIG
jgi:hypothetical protein